jgi:uncharacterized membrane-anchored protein YitT (DUF2179 family)
MSKEIKNSIIYNTIGGIILAFILYNIHSLSYITEGGMLGLSLILEFAFNISPAISSIIFNVISYLIGFKVLGKKFIFGSLFAAGSFSLSYAIFEQFPPIYPQISQMPLLAAIVGGIFVGGSVGLCVRFNGAPSGDDALAMSARDTFKMDIRLVYFILDITVLSLSFIYINYKRVLFSILSVIVSGIVLGFMQNVGKDKRNNKEKQNV